MKCGRRECGWYDSCDRRDGDFHCSLWSPRFYAVVSVL